MIATLALLGASSARASCTLKIVKVTPCLASGAAGTPEIGTPYGIRVTFDVTGTPTHPFGIKFTIANVTHTFNGYNLRAGNGYYSYFVADLCLDDVIPYSVTLDPANVSGNTNPNTTVSGSFSPTPPATIVQTYSPSTKNGAVSRTLTFSSGATLSSLYTLIGVPTSHGAQVVIKAPTPANFQLVTTAPYNLPAFQSLQTNVPSGTYTFGNTFSVTLSRMRVNPKLLRKITWASLGTLPAEYAQWLTPDNVNESTDPAIASFVSQALPSDYRTALTPYDAARTLHKAVMRALIYTEPPPYDDAVSSLQVGEGDCGCYAALLVSSLRSIGIPARRILGFWTGFSQSHVRAEFYLPGAGWMVADPTLGNGVDPTGTYAYYFGSVSDSDQFVAVDVGDSHEMTEYSVDAQGLQTPNFWYEVTSGPVPTIEANNNFSYLQPGLTAEYTLLLQPTTSSPGIPQGTGYGLLTMSSTGGIILSGQLADGESYSTSGALGGSDGDQFIFSTPLAYPASAQGTLSGTLSFVTTTGPFRTTGTGDLSGTITWIKPQESSGNFPAAFQTTLNSIGSLYTAPASGAGVLPGFTAGTLTLSGTSALTTLGATTLVKDVSLSAANAFKITNPSTDKLTLTVTPSTGVFKGTFHDYRPGGASLLTTFTGVVFQQEANGGGYFLNTTNSGGVTLTP